MWSDATHGLVTRLQHASTDESSRPASVFFMNRCCARPTCAVSAAATMSYDYDARIVWIEPLHAEPHPMTHDLCAQHADRSTPPSGWELRDERSPRGIYALHAS